MHVLNRLSLLDWCAIAVYFLIIIVVGIRVRRRGEDERGFVRANQSIPFWAVGVSMLATALAADDFIGEPQFSFKSDIALLGAFAVGYVGVIIVAVCFLPAFYRSNALTIYGFLGQRFGPKAQIAASAMSCAGNVFSAGMGLFVAAFAITPLLGDGSLDYQQLRIWVTGIIIGIGVVGTVYTAIGGIRSVIWTDVIQMVVVFAGGLYAIVFLTWQIPLDFSEMVHRWNEAVYETGQIESANKLQVFRSTGGVSDPYSPVTLPLWAIFFVGIFGTNHGYTQRLLACRSARHAGVGMVFGYTVGMLSAVMFVAIGLLLFLFNDPSVMGADSASANAFGSSEEVFPRLVVNFFPAGVLGLCLSAMIAAVMSSFDSATAAVASSFTVDVWRPIRKLLIRGGKAYSEQKQSPWIATAVTGTILTASGAFAAMTYDPENTLLVDFVLGFASFPIGGMLGVFCTALFTKRGNATSAIGALVVGPLVWLFVQPDLLDMVTQPVFGASITLESLSKTLGGHPLTLAWPWWFSISGVVSFGVCVVGKPANQLSDSTE